MARTAPARRARQFDYFADQIDPERNLPAEELARRVEHLRREHYLRMAYKSVKARQARAAERRARGAGATPPTAPDGPRAA